MYLLKTALSALIIVGLFLAGCSEDEPPPRAASTVEDLHPLDQMVLAFEGNHSRSAIQARIDEAMSLYGLALTKENYSRAGSVLVALRKKYGPSEMEFLDYMIRSHAEGVNIDYPEMAAISAVALSTGAE